MNLVLKQTIFPTFFTNRIRGRTITIPKPKLNAAAVTCTVNVYVEISTCVVGCGVAK